MAMCTQLHLTTPLPNSELVGMKLISQDSHLGRLRRQRQAFYRRLSLREPGTSTAGASSRAALARLLLRPAGAVSPLRSSGGADRRPASLREASRLRRQKEAVSDRELRLYDAFSIDLSLPHLGGYDGS